MSIDDCLLTEAITTEQRDALEDGVIAVEEMLRKDGKLREEVIRATAERMAVEEALKQAKRKKYLVALQVDAEVRINKHIDSHPDGVRRGVNSVLVRDIENHTGNSPISNVEGRRRAIEANLFSHFTTGTDKLRTKWAGFSQDKKLAADVVRELFGEKTGNSTAKIIAEEFRKVSDIARGRFNDAGGDIAVLQDWGLPQSHNEQLVKEAGKDVWLAYIVPKLDRTKMIDQSTGVPFTDVKFDAMMDKMYDTISTGGLSDLVPGQQGGTKLANRRQDHRALHFKTADEWMDYSVKFGAENPYDIMTSHIRGMAGDTAQLEVMGPNPDAMFRKMHDRILIDEGRSLKGSSFSQSLYNTVSGKVDVIDSLALANASAAFRSLMVASKLGSALLSALPTDLVFLGTTAAWNKLPVTSVIRNMVTSLNPLKEEDRLFATSLGFQVETWINSAASGQRFSGDFTDSKGFAGGAAEKVMRLSGLPYWTDANSQAFSVSFSQNTARQIKSNLSFDELGQTKQSFINHGIDEEAWEIIKRAEVVNFKGVDHFKPNSIIDVEGVSKKKAVDVMSKYMELLQTETRLAVPQAGDRVKAITTSGFERGTKEGEFSRLFFLFKSFPIAIITEHLARAGLFSPTVAGTRNLGYGSSLIIGLTIMGGLSWQLKQIAKGKTPEDMDSTEFWVKAAIQGGAIGIFADFLSSSESRFGNSFLATLAGPTAGFTEDIQSLIVDNAADPEGNTFTQDALKILRQNAPGTNLWYTRQLSDRFIWDNLQQMVDPNAAKAWARQRRRLKKETGQEYYWKPGSSTL